MGGEKYKQNVYIEQQILILTHFIKETYALYEYMPLKIPQFSSSIYV